MYNTYLSTNLSEREPEFCNLIGWSVLYLSIDYKDGYR